MNGPVTSAIQSVQDVPIGAEQRESLSASWGVILPRGPLLPAWGTRERDYELWRWAIHDRNWLFKSAVAGLGKKIASTPWKIVGDNPETSPDEARQILTEANFGRGWRDFVLGWVWNYCTHDILGAIVERTGPGDPRGPIWGLPSGFALLDPFYCFPTGNPTWPVLYWEAPAFKRKLGDAKRGTWRWLHRERVDYTVDQPIYRRHYPGAGICAADRAISIMQQQIYADSYIAESLDDRPQPGIYHTHNIDPASWDAAWARLRQRLDNDFLDEEGNTITIKSLQTDADSKIDLLQFSTPPEKFDYEQYTGLFVKATAAALGVDVQELWELTGNASLGTATQSAVLARKGEGKTEADIYAALERFTMSVLPEGYNLEFEFKDFEQDQQEAAISAQTMQTVTMAVSSGMATTEQAARYLALKDDTWRRVYEEPEAEVVTDRDPVEKEPEEVTTIFRAWSTTRAEFVQRLSEVFQRTHTGPGSGRRLSNSIRALLRNYGQLAYEDGLTDAGVEKAELGTRDKMRLQSWLSDEGAYVTNLIEGQQELRRGLAPGEAKTKADLWANKSLRAIYQTAMKTADVMLQWVLNPLKENCTTCLALNGQVHAASEWKESGWEPGVSWLECGGFECGCAFAPAPGAKARGNLSAVAKVVH